MTYQQYLSYQYQNPLDSVMPMPMTMSEYAYPNDPSKPQGNNLFTWNTNGFENVVMQNEVPLGTSLSEIYDMEKNGACPPMRKKRKCSEIENSKDISSVKLSRDQLLKISSDEFEDFVKRLNFGRNLSKSEEKEIKRQRRLIKNREYAQEARKKKKMYVSDLESKVKHLNEENADLRCKAEELENEVLMLRERVSELEKLTDSSFGSDESSLSDYSPQVDTYFPEVEVQMDLDNPWSFNGFQNGVFLMVFLFSFGLLFNFEMFGLVNPESPQIQSPFSGEIHNTIPTDSSPWKGPRKLSSSLTDEARKSCALSSSPLPQKLSVEDIYNDEANLYSSDICFLNDYQLPKTLCVN